MKKIAIILLFFLCFQAFSQKKNDDYEFGNVSPLELNMTVYEKDTTANAVVLYEHSFSKFIKKNNRIHLQTTVYRKIKFLNNRGFKNATVELNLFKIKHVKEKVYKIKGVTHNGKNKTYLKEQNIFNTEPRTNLLKTTFTLPNVKDGSVIEYTYTIESPYIYKLKSWHFQSSIPKVKSIFVAKIPQKFFYNRKLIGDLQLVENSADIQKKCFYVSGEDSKAYACEVLRYSMENIPAFITEYYLTSKKNYIARIEFELSQYRKDLGATRIYSSTWKYVEDNINKYFGSQLNKTNYFKNEIPLYILSEKNKLERAKKVYFFIQNHFNWNNQNWNQSEIYVKDAFKKGVGSVDEINISLINSLNAAGIDSKLTLLSTRKNGIPVKTYPVISDFNYIIAKIEVDGKSIFLDATDKSLPFGVLPFRCLNGDARVMDFKNGSYWEEVKPIDDTKLKINMLLQLNKNDEAIKGKLRITRYGYEALDSRKKYNLLKEKKYLSNIEERNENILIESYLNKNLDEKEKPFIEKFEITIENDNTIGDKIILTPFFINPLKENPFKLESRLYPVDFGYPIKNNFVITIVIPENYIVESMPTNKNIALPNNKGMLNYSSNHENNKISINFKYAINATVFKSDEYLNLKEFFNQIILSQSEPIILIKQTR
ncbi:MAG: hypothetical protein QM478_05065 [Flavobacteriaceae bacterium]